MKRNSFNLVEHYKNISNHLFSQYLLSSSYGHRGSKGQIREDFMIRTLQEMAHDYIKLNKGEICDSKGRRSSEFDIIISYLSNTIRLFGSDMTKVVPVETVLSIIEVKSILSMDSIEKFNNDIKSLNSFERFYLPTPTYKIVGDITGSKEYTQIDDHSISPNKGVLGITPIFGGVIAFESPKIETVQKWLDEFTGELNFFFIFVLGHFFANRDINNKMVHSRER